MPTALLILACCLAGCGGTQGAAAPRASTFQAGDERLFDDTVDLVANPESLGGRWQSDWEQELNGRFKRGDLVVEGTLRTVRIDKDLGGHRTLRLVLEIDRAYKGTATGSELSLSVREGEAGFGNVDRNRTGILQRKLVAFVKYQDLAGKIVLRWHLSSHSEHLQKRLSALEEGMTPSHITVIERTN